MLNKNMPAMPIPAAPSGGMYTAIDLYQSMARHSILAFGLTKREDFAKAAMQGLLSSMNLCEIHSASTSDVDAITNLSILMADSVLEALDKQVK